MKMLCVPLFALLSVPVMSQADTWSIRADSWCPYNCEPSDNHSGYMIEIIELAAKSAGHKVDYKIVPWSRALVDVRLGQVNGVVGASDGDREGLTFTEKLGVDQACFYVNQGDAFKYSGINDLTRLRSVGTAQGYEYTADFMKWAKTNPDKVQVMTGDDPTTSNVKKLKANRIQAMLLNSNVFQSSRKTVPEMKDLVSAGCLESIDLYAGFGTANPKTVDIVKSVNAKLAELKKSGGMSKLLGKYGIAAW